MSTTERTATCAIPEPGARGLALLLAVLLLACEGEQGPAGPPGPPGGGGGGGDEPTPTEYAAGDPVPELRLAILELQGASGPAGEFLIGDRPSVTFELVQQDGRPWSLAELSEGQALISGPTFNYQRVLPPEDVLAGDVQGDVDGVPGRRCFRFSLALPEVFAPPYNDSPAFGPSDGDRGGLPLLDGTYTLGLSFSWAYTVDGQPHLRVGEAHLDFLLGTGAGELTPRAVTSEAHCNRCHTRLEAHEGRHRDLVLCLLCHTSGAEDANDPDIAAGTPGVSVDSRVLFHRLHSGRFLPSVVGMSTRGNGNRNYNTASVPLVYARPDGVLRDFSDVGFPAMPNRTAPMPRDVGYDGLTPDQQEKEDRVRSGPTDCAICHGDPDGAGPLETPAQGGLVYAQMSRRACGSCHNDFSFTGNYRSNGQTMPPQTSDNNCQSCHETRFPGPLNPRDAHQHPLRRSDENPGLNLTLLAVEEAGGNGNGRADPGEKLRLELTLVDDQGAEVDPLGLDALTAVLAGPTTNFQVLLAERLPLFLATGPQPWSLPLTQRLELERLGTGSAGTDLFQSARFPHYQGPGLATRVFVRSGTSGGASVLAAAAAGPQNFVDLLDADGFERDDFVVVDDGAGDLEEYLRVQFVEQDRLWFSSPRQPGYPAGLRQAHPAGAAVREVQLLERVQDTHWSLDELGGAISEISPAGFPDGAVVLASYTSDYLVPSRYPAALNDSPERDPLQGDWSGLALLPGTYRLTLAAERSLTSFAGNQRTVYRIGSRASARELLVGAATEPVPYGRIADPTSCDACHQELSYHDLSTSGFEGCIGCHGASGSEDLPRYAAAGAPATPGRSVEFRTLVHRIHRGRESRDPGYQVVGAGPGTYPDNFRTRSYSGYSPFPSFPERTLACERCHGPGNLDSLLPAERSHPDEPSRPVQIWRPVCSGCHDSVADGAHLDSNTAPNGAEACEICHLPGELADALVAHGFR